ncbi:long-chain fatty acid--CoA ligase [Nocardia tengchongensis]|uniref:long-chain-fatty-acid--CoA ligase n=1 Tax=Nocardia tengchongensis TaxID=2055889 RepID=UPI0033E33F4D
MGINLATILRESATACPDKALVHLGDESFTYRQVDEISGRVAGSLIDLGLRRGDKVAVQLPNVPQFLFAYFGILKAGLVVVPLNPLLVEREVAYHLADSGARVLITFETFAAQALAGAKLEGVDTYVVTVQADTQIPSGTKRFDVLYRAVETPDIVSVAAEDTAVLLYTSGTTGKPKGAELTHFELYMNCSVAGELFGYTASDISLAALPMFHVFGLSCVLNLAVLKGATVVLVARFEPPLVIDAIEKYSCTVFFGVPTYYQMLLGEEIAGRNLTALRCGISGGAALPGEVMRAFEEKFSGVVILEGYGLSETAAAATFNKNANERKVGSIGKPIWGVEVRIIDESGRELPAGAHHIGEVVIRGHNVMKGYHNRPEATAEVLRDGWFHTGDLGYRDEEGFFFLVDRIKDLVIRGGLNVYPREIEEVLYAHPAVAEAAVIGKPDERLGEEIVAVIALRPDAAAEADELIAFCRERLAAYKYPREIRLIDTLPKGPSGKILKKALRA